MSCIQRLHPMYDKRSRSRCLQSSLTADGLDNLPYWFLKIAAPFISLPLSYLFNLSFLQSTVPLQWKASCITPVPKVEQPQTCADYRPISITHILARIMEKQIARIFLYPVLTHPDSVYLFEDYMLFALLAHPLLQSISFFTHLLSFC